MVTKEAGGKGFEDLRGLPGFLFPKGFFILIAGRKN